MTTTFLDTVFKDHPEQQTIIMDALRPWTGHMAAIVLHHYATSVSVTDERSPIPSALLDRIGPVLDVIMTIACRPAERIRMGAATIVRSNAGLLLRAIILSEIIPLSVLHRIDITRNTETEYGEMSVIEAILLTVTRSRQGTDNPWGGDTTDALAITNGSSAMPGIPEAVAKALSKVPGP